ncbi:MAG: carbamate kinase [Planctomycetota bacterium]|nr:carbamate kinase [Planctomycetota bacterium]
MTTILAFGGNALLPDPFHPEGQEERARDLASAVLLLLARSRGLVLVHGNGPQVGMILLRVEATRERLPPEPLDVLVAETQGSIGYLLVRALGNALREHGSPLEVTSILTQVVVDPDDPAFDKPEKPIGPFYSERNAELLREKRGWHMTEVAGKGWRRVVASPRPQRVVEITSIAEAAEAGRVVVAGGGGGVPVRDDEGELSGMEAVIDKDRTSALLAITLRAESFVILTGVPHVSRAFGTPAEERVAELSMAEARALLEAAEFPPGSMGPKIEAACDYAEATGHHALITDTPSLAAALEGRAGTRIAP